MNKENIAVTKLESEIARSDYLESQIPRNDKGPSWDGEIYVYNKPGDTHKKEDLICRVPIQVKGHESTKIHHNKIKFQADVSDLINYLKDGGAVYFVVYFNKNEEERQIYYKKLLPFDLKRLIKEAKSQKKKTISLIPFPKDPKKFSDLFLNIAKDIEKQKADSSTEKIWTLEELKNSGMSPKLELSYSTFNKKDFSLMDGLIDQGMYVYAKTSLGISFPVEYVEEITAAALERRGDVSVGDKVFYKTYRIIKTSNSIEIELGSSIIFTNDKFKFTPKGTLSQRILDYQFLQALIKRKVILINGCELLKVNLNEKTHNKIIIERLNELQTIKEMLTALDYTDDLEMDNLEKKDYFNIGRLVAAFKGEEVPLYDTGRPYGTYRIGNIKLLVSAMKNEKTGDFRIYNFFKSPVKYAIMDKDKNLYEIPSCLVLNTDDIADNNNVNYDLIKSQFVDMNFNAINSEYAILFVLKVLNAYDFQHNNTFLLETASELLEIVKEKSSLIDRMIIRLNELQIIKRKRNLNLAERSELMQYLKEDNDIEIRIGIYILLDAFVEAELNFDSLTEDRKEAFKQYPIFFFMPKQ